MAAMSFLSASSEDGSHVFFFSAAPSSSFHGGGLPVGRSDPCLFGFYPQTGNSQRPSLSIRCQSTNTKEPKSSCNILDNASNLFRNLLSGRSLGSMPTAEGAVSDLFGKPLFLSLYDWFMEHGGVYKLAFGPKAFVVISDPIVAACPQREHGVLAEILEPVMGKGLIHADLDTWKLRRRAITPAFHALYLEAMVKSYEEYVEIHIRCMRQLGLPVSDSTITCLQVKQMMGKLMMMVIHVDCSKELPASCWSSLHFTKVLANFCIDQDLGITLGSKLMASGQVRAL
ncbi:hypothetical protein Bca101_089767 [Brassica carinata]